MNSLLKLAYFVMQTDDALPKIEYTTIDGRNILCTELLLSTSFFLRTDIVDTQIFYLTRQLRKVNIQVIAISCLKKKNKIRIYFKPSSIRKPKKEVR
jgi:hypothetical protein